jgi:diaminopimelate epimerase
MASQLSQTPIMKLSATGNDFLLVDLRTKPAQTAWKKQWGRKSRAQLVKLWCHRFEGLGADGMVFLESDKKEDFAWDFYNSDGSHAEMCGNAARAVSLYASQLLKKSKLSFRTKAGVVCAVVKSDKNIEVRLPKVGEGQWNQVIEWKGAKLNFDFIRAGVPHVVVRVPNLEDRSSLRDFALEIKRRPSFLKEGTNVTFVRLISQEKVEAVTFERGVEDFTLSCGTGAVASAHSVLRGEENQAVEVHVPGGTLSVIWKEGFPHLRGPAKIIAQMYPRC